MKIAIAAQGDNPGAPVDIRFGRAPHFALFDQDNNSFEWAPNTQNLSLPQGAGIQAAKNVIETGAGVLIARNVGPKAFNLLTQSGVAMYICEEGTPVSEAIGMYQRGELIKLEDANAEGHW
ncbi:MAG: NifB/NifX family molybdenum-iron cluster-binding protein [Spirochaetes bacterium]|nr:NifB/NifX family molybdenum-iron cluster-binding protein [Spirochaetota bacterium]